MKAENLYKAMNYIDDEIIYRNGKVERIVDIKQKSKKQVNKKQVFRIMVAVAAAAVLFTGMGIIRPLEKAVVNTGTGDGSEIEVVNNDTNTSLVQSTRNMFVITANAAEPISDEQDSAVASGDIMSICNTTASFGSSLYMDQRFAISGENIEKVKISTDKCNIYSVVPIYEGDSDYEKAQRYETSGNDDYQLVVDEEGTGEDAPMEGISNHYEHLVVAGSTYEGIYDNTMMFGMSVPQELWSTNSDLQKSFWEDIDQVAGATITIEVTFTDGSIEVHHYQLSTGKIFVPTDENGYNQWDNLTRFLTAEEEAAGESYAYGYLMNKID